MTAPVRYLCTSCGTVQVRQVSGTPRRLWWLPCCRRRHTLHHVFERRPFTGGWA